MFLLDISVIMKSVILKPVTRHFGEHKYEIKYEISVLIKLLSYKEISYRAEFPE